MMFLLVFVVALLIGVVLLGVGGYLLYQSFHEPSESWTGSPWLIRLLAILALLGGLGFIIVPVVTFLFGVPIFAR